MIIINPKIPAGVYTYFSTYSFVLQHGWAVARVSVFFTILFDFLALVGQVGVLGFLAQIPRYLSYQDQVKPQAATLLNSGSASIMSFIQHLETFAFSLSLPIFISISVLLSFTSFLLSTVFRYAASFSARKAARSYHYKMVSDAYKTAVKSTFWRSGDEAIEFREFQLNFSRYPIHVSKAFELIIRLTPVIIALPIGFIAAFSMEPLATTILFALAFLLAPIGFIVGRQIHNKSTQFFEHEAIAFNGLINQMFGKAHGQLMPNQKVSFEPIQNSFQSFLDSFDAVQLASDKMTLATGITRALMLLAVLSTLSYIAIRSGSVNHIFIYSTILFVVLNSIQTAMSNIASLNIYGPQAIRHHDLYKKIFQKDYKPKQSVSKSDIPINSDENFIFIEVVSAKKFTRTSHNSYLEAVSALIGKESDKTIFFVPDMLGQPEFENWTFNDLISAYKEKTGRDMFATLSQWTVEKDLETFHFENTILKKSPVEALGRFSSSLRTGLLLCLSQIFDADVVELSAGVMAPVSERDLERYAPFLQGKILLRRALPQHELSTANQFVILADTKTYQAVKREDLKPEMIKALQNTNDADSEDSVGLLV